MLSLFIANSLFDHFPALTIKHSFVRHLLVTGVWVIIHLLAFSNLFAIGSNGPFSFSLVNFADWLAIRPYHSFIAVRLHLEMRASSLWHAEAFHHIVAHLAHHFVHASKHAFSRKERIILEGVTHAKTWKHSFRYLVHFIMATLHHFEHITPTKRLQGRLMTVWLHGGAFGSRVRLDGSVTICH